MSNVAAIREHTEQTGDGLLLLIILAETNGAPGPKLPELMGLLGLGKRQVQRVIKDLEANGDITITRGQGKGHASVYTIPYLPVIAGQSDKVTAETPFQKVTSAAPTPPEKVSSGPPLSDAKVTPETPLVGKGDTADTSDGGTPIAPYSDIRTSTDSSSATLRNIVGLTPDAPSVDERAKALRKAIAELPKHKRCAQPTEGEWVLMLDIFAEWRRAMGKNGKAKLTPERGRALLDRLRSPVGFTREDFSAAIKGCRASPQHMGQNDRGTVYDDLELICRNDQNLERFKGYAEAEVESGQETNIVRGSFSRPNVSERTARQNRNASAAYAFAAQRLAEAEEEV